MFATIKHLVLVCAALHVSSGRMMNSLGGVRPDRLCLAALALRWGSLLGLNLVGMIVFPGRVPGGLTGVARPMIVEGAKIVWWIAVSWATKSPPGWLFPDGKYP